MFEKKGQAKSHRQQDIIQTFWMGQTEVQMKHTCLSLNCRKQQLTQKQINARHNLDSKTDAWWQETIKKLQQGLIQNRLRITQRWQN